MHVLLFCHSSFFEDFLLGTHHQHGIWSVLSLRLLGDAGETDINGLARAMEFEMTCAQDLEAKIAQIIKDLEQGQER